MPNARLAERVPFLAEVDVMAMGAPAPRRVWGTDVSETGMFLQTTHGYRVGDRVSLRFAVETDEVHVTAAEVVWVRPFEPVSVDGALPGVGLKFVAIDPRDRARIRHYARPQARNTDPERPALGALPHVFGSLRPMVHAFDDVRGVSPQTDEMLAMSLAPFTQLPMDAPRAVTLAPAPAMPLAPDATTEPVFALEGWRFDKAARNDGDAPHEGDVSAAANDDDGDHAAARTTLPESPAPASFDAALDAPLDAAPAPAFSTSHASFITEVPHARERRGGGGGNTSRRGPSNLALAFAFLGAGALVGSGLGLLGRSLQDDDSTVADTKVAAPASAAPAVAAPKSVAEAERDLKPEIVKPVAAQEAAAIASLQAPPVSKVEAKAEPKVEAKIENKPEAKAVLQTEPSSTTKNDSAPRTDRIAAALAGVAKSVKQDALALSIGSDARIVKTFALKGPARFVVDFEGGALPASPPTSLPAGVTLVRFGHPTPTTSRIVFELAEGAPAGHAALRDGSLVVTLH